MLAKKLNRVYTIDENDKNKYLKNGFDIINEKGEVVENAITKTITYSEHNKIVEELKEKHQNEIAELNVALIKANDVPKNATELKKVNAELTAANEALAKEVEELKAQVEELTKVGENDGQVQE